jgi:thiol-disulfide isomerase/thioredoxin
MQSSRRLLVAFIALMISSWALYQHFQPEAPSQAAINTAQIPTNFFSQPFKNLKGDNQDLSAWQGKIIVLNFWAPWCPPCLEEMPELSALHQTYQDKNVVVIGLSAEALDTTRDYFKEDPKRAVSYPIVVGDLDAMDLSAKLGNQRGVLPYTVIIHSDGTIIKTFLGRINQPLIEKSLLPIVNP